MTPLELPRIRFGSLLLAAFLGCGGAETNGAPTPDASAGDDANGTASPDASAGDDAARGPIAADAADAPGHGPDATEEGPDAGACAGVRCAAPPPCDRPCTTSCCCSRPSCPAADGGADGGTADAGSGDGAPCTGPGDCRLFSDMCGTCACLALGVAAADPVCSGTSVACFQDPCGGQSAGCRSSHCVAQTQ